MPGHEPNPERNPFDSRYQLTSLATAPSRQPLADGGIQRNLPTMEDCRLETAELAINKLIILSILSRIQGVTLNQLTTLALETLYMDYFDFVTAYEELCQDHLAVESVRKNEEVHDANGRPVTRCDLTPEGRTILDTLEPRIPLPIRSYLAQACSGWQKDIRLERTLTATCEPDGNGYHLVCLKLNDGLKDLIDLRMTIPDRIMAQQVCERWRRHPQTVYLGLLSQLTGEPSLTPEEMLPASAFRPFASAEKSAVAEEVPGMASLDPQQQTLFNL
jgi:hypothetical protein